MTAGPPDIPSGELVTEDRTEDRPPPKSANYDFLRAGPGVVRIAAGAWWQTTQWAIGTSVRATTRIVRGAMSGEATATVLRQLGSDARDRVRRLLGIVDLEGRLGSVLSEEDQSNRGTARGPNGAVPGSLRERGDELLRRSADIRYEESTHPAYDRMLTDLAPDEGRILLLLCHEGAQPAVDVRTARPLNIGSQLVAAGLSMIGEEAGCRYLEQVPAYLNNLQRLGLIWFSREPLEDPLSYQVLEAQPDVTEAKREAGRGRTVRRSIVLTPLGGDFCRACLPVEEVNLDAHPGAVPPGT